jgi:hypothetical protein
MPLAQRMRYYPAVGPAIPHRKSCSSRVTHPFATDPCGPVRLACVKHAASVRPEPGSNSPMSVRYQALRERPGSVVRITIRDLKPSPPSSTPVVRRVRTPVDSDSHHLSKSFGRDDARNVNSAAAPNPNRPIPLGQGAFEPLRLAASARPAGVARYRGPWPRRTDSTVQPFHCPTKCWAGNEGIRIYAELGPVSMLALPAFRRPSAGKGLRKGTAILTLSTPPCNPWIPPHFGPDCPSRGRNLRAIG